MAKRKRRRGAPALLSREERFALRLARDDLATRMRRVQDADYGEELADLEVLFDNVERERREDRASRPRRRRR